MESTFTFNQFSERDNLVAQLIACIALNETENPLFEKAKEALNLSGDITQLLNHSLNSFEDALNSKDESLADLLESTTKNACCS